jgi:hypothetical protein
MSVYFKTSQERTFIDPCLSVNKLFGLTGFRITKPWMLSTYNRPATKPRIGESNSHCISGCGAQFFVISVSFPSTILHAMHLIQP